jgi:hypothetical protein
MPKDVRIWEVQARDRLAELKPAKLDLEERIETWLEQDISIISDDLLVIGRQVSTSFGGAIDLLCLDSNLVPLQAPKGARQPIPASQHTPSCRCERPKGARQPPIPFTGTTPGACFVSLTRSQPS